MSDNKVKEINKDIEKKAKKKICDTFMSIQRAFCLTVQTFSEQYEGNNTYQDKQGFLYLFFNNLKFQKNLKSQNLLTNL